MLISLLWPDHDDTRGRQALRNALHGVRQLLGSDILISAGDGLIGLDHERLSCDAYELERGEWTSADSPGEPLHGFHVSGAHEFDEWLDHQRARLSALRSQLDVRGADRERPVASARAPSLSVPSTAQRPAQMPDAYSLYIRRHYLFLRASHGGSPDELHRCRMLFERALAVDDRYAPAVAGLSNYYAVAARREVLTPFDSTFARAIEYSHHALELDDSLAVPHVHFGVKAWFLDDEFDRAGVEFERATTKDPSYAEGRRFFGAWLGFMNRHDEALREISEAARLEPDIPHILSSLGAARVSVGDHEGAETAFRATLSLDATHAAARDRLLRLLELQERYADAIAERSRAPAMSTATDFRDAWLQDGASGYLRMRTSELRARAQAIETRLLEQPARRVADIFSPPEVQLAATYAQLGELRKVRAWQLQACASRPGMARWFASVPELRALSA